MPRSHRICLPNVTYIVYSRCIEWKNMMQEDYFKDLFIETLQRTQKKYEFELNFYQIMDNHFHLVIKTVNNGESISRIMQYIKSRFAESFNRSTKRIGPFWNERFKDIIVENQENPIHFLLWLLWYIACNPVRKKIVKNPRDYRYGCIRSYLHEDMYYPLKVTIHEYFLKLGKTFIDCVKEFLYFEEAYRRKRAIIW